MLEYRQRTDREHVLVISVINSATQGDKRKIYVSCINHLVSPFGDLLRRWCNIVVEVKFCVLLTVVEDDQIYVKTYLDGSGSGDDSVNGTTRTTTESTTTVPGVSTRSFNTDGGSGMGSGDDFTTESSTEFSTLTFSTDGGSGMGSGDDFTTESSTEFSTLTFSTDGGSGTGSGDDFMTESSTEFSTLTVSTDGGSGVDGKW